MAPGSPIINVTREAQEDVDNTVAFLEDSWPIEVAIQFLEAYFAKLDLIESMPGIGRRSSGSPGVRKFPIDRYNMLYYEELGSQIIVLRVIDSRRNPADNPFDN
jgi:plasmid stabilization system protein ParE